MYNNKLLHYGIKGQRKGHRRYQNPDGSLTASGKERYGNWEDKKIAWKIAVRKYNKEQGYKKLSWNQQVANYNQAQISENLDKMFKETIKNGEAFIENQGIQQQVIYKESR